jgi:hypothetical protein
MAMVREMGTAMYLVCLKQTENKMEEYKRLQKELLMDLECAIPKEKHW